MGTRDDLPAAINAVVDHIASDAEAWCEPLRTTLIAYLPGAAATRLWGLGVWCVVGPPCITLNTVNIAHS